MGKKEEGKVRLPAISAKRERRKITPNNKARKI